MPDTPAARLDRAVDELVSGRSPQADPELGRLVDVALLLRSGLRPVPISERFEARLAQRLQRRGLSGWIAQGTVEAAEAARRELRQRAGLLRTGVVGSAAVGVAGVTAYAVWRVAHR